MLSPKKTKHRKAFKGRIHGVAQRGNIRLGVMMLQHEKKSCVQTTHNSTHDRMPATTDSAHIDGECTNTD